MVTMEFERLYRSTRHFYLRPRKYISQTPAPRVEIYAKSPLARHFRGISIPGVHALEHPTLQYGASRPQLSKFRAFYSSGDTRCKIDRLAEDISGLYGHCTEMNTGTYF